MIYGQQSSSLSLTCNVQKENDSNTVQEDAGQILLRDAALTQDRVYFLIQPEDDTGSPLTGLEGVSGSGVADSISNTRNAGEFKQFDMSLTGGEQPNFFTVS